MGTVVTYERTGTFFFRRTLARIEPLLKEHGYCGYINLNTIVNSQGIWPLEFTCRFGYPGYAILSPLQRTPWAMLFRSMVTHKGTHLDTAPGFAVGIVLTTRPFPYTRTSVREPVGLPILSRETSRNAIGQICTLGKSRSTKGSLSLQDFTVGRWSLLARVRQSPRPKPTPTSSCGAWSYRTYAIETILVQSLLPATSRPWRN